MSKPAFTPGPWSVGFADGSGPECIVAGENNAVVMGGDSFGLTYGVKNPADATLIAAAPTMFSLIEKKAADGDQDAIAFMEAFNVRT